MPSTVGVMFRWVGGLASTFLATLPTADLSFVAALQRLLDDHRVGGDVGVRLPLEVHRTTVGRVRGLALATFAEMASVVGLTHLPGRSGMVTVVSNVHPSAGYEALGIRGCQPAS